MDSQDDASIEDWELFADPREIERRKAERKRAALPAEVTARQINVSRDKKADVE